jgi:hypothetical protein
MRGKEALFRRCAPLTTHCRRGALWLFSKQFHMKSSPKFTPRLLKKSKDRLFGYVSPPHGAYAVPSRLSCFGADHGGAASREKKTERSATAFGLVSLQRRSEVLTQMRSRTRRSSVSCSIAGVARSSNLYDERCGVVEGAPTKLPATLWGHREFPSEDLRQRVTPWS